MHLNERDKGVEYLTIDTGDAGFSIDCGDCSANDNSESDVTWWAADTETFYGNKFARMLAGTEEFHVGEKPGAFVAESVELYAGFKQEATLTVRAVPWLPFHRNELIDQYQPMPRLPLLARFFGVTMNEVNSRRAVTAATAERRP